MSTKGKQNNELAGTLKGMTAEELRTALADRDAMIRNLNSTVESLTLAQERKELSYETTKKQIEELTKTVSLLTKNVVMKTKEKKKASKKKKNSPKKDEENDDINNNSEIDDVDETKNRDESENRMEAELSEQSSESDSSDDSDGSSNESFHLDSSSEDEDAVVDRKDRVKMNLPTPFKGTRSAETVEIFISQLKSYCYLTAVPKEARVVLFKSLLVGTAKKWWKSIAKTKRQKLSFSDALNELHREFHPELQAENARETLDRLKYYPGKFRQFKDMFRNVTFEIKDMSESEKLHVFKKKLPAEFQFEILKLRCKTVKKAMKIASELDFTQRQAGMHDHKKTPGNDKNNNNSKKDVTLGNVKVDPKADKKKWVNELKALDKNVLQKRRMEGLCLNCGDPDHRIDSCPGPHRRQ